MSILNNFAVCIFSEVTNLAKIKPTPKIPDTCIRYLTTCSMYLMIKTVHVIDI